MANKPAVPSPERETFRHRLWDNSVTLFLLSLVCAFAAWMVVTMYFDNRGSYTIANATVNYSYQSSVYTALDLNIVEQPNIGNVRVSAKGNNTIIGSMSAADIMVYPNYSPVNGPGEVTLRLEARLVNNDYANQGIELTVESPTTITLMFDSVIQKTVPVTVENNGVAIADGFTLQRTASVPAEVVLRGPASELDRIASVVAPVSLNEELADTAIFNSILEMRDENGEKLDLRYTTADTETAEVTMTVYQVRELPLSVDFIGLPSRFDVSSLKYTLSRETLRVAGPARIVQNMSELSVTSFDLSQEFAFNRDYQRQIELPSGIVSQEGIGAVTLSFDTSGMDSKVLNLDNIQLINVPSNLEVEVLTHIVNDVRVYGPRQEVQLLTANSVLAQVDCQYLTLTGGQQVVPVTIQIPYSSRIFAVGSYTVECLITEK